MREWPLRTVDPALASRWVADGFWTDETLGQLLATSLDANRGVAFSVRSATNPWRGTFGDVLDLARRVAGGLRDRGIGPDSVVAFQLSNRVEAAAVFYAVSMLGAVIVPIVHFYGTKEVGYILRRSEPDAFIHADRFGAIDYLANRERLREEGVPDVPLEVVIGAAPAGTVPWTTLIEADPLEAPVAVDPAAPALIAYTSGTTANPKGVIHVHRTIVFEVKQLGAVQPPGPPSLWGYPVGHAGGMLATLLLPLYRGQPSHLVDAWVPDVVLQGMLEDELSAGSGAIYFLTSLLDHPDLTPKHLELMHYVGLGMSSVPAAISDRAVSLGLSVVRMYGSTEHPSITGATHDEPAEKRMYTDGRPLPGVEIRLADDGEIFSRGPDCFMGYTDPDLTRTVFDADGWYRTEDVGELDADGYLTIVDRKKDIIIRGGENVSALEVEEMLLRIPGIAEVAVVAAPDARMGEHACAFVRPLPGQAVPDLATVQSHLAASGLAKQKWPEELREVDDFPRTPSGKVQKFVLRTRLRTGDGA